MEKQRTTAVIELERPQENEPPQNGEAQSYSEPCERELQPDTITVIIIPHNGSVTILKDGMEPLIYDNLGSPSEDPSRDIALQPEEEYYANDKTDPVDIYLEDISRSPLLTRKEEIVLAKKMTQGKLAQKELDAIQQKRCNPSNPEDIDELQNTVNQADAAKQKLVESNLRLVVSIAKKYVGRGVTLLDLIQEGNIGLMRAVDKFDYRRGNKFSTHATWWIRQAISRAIKEQSRSVRLPEYIHGLINTLNRAENALSQELERNPTKYELANSMDSSPEKIEEIKKVEQRPMSLSTPAGEEEDLELGDCIEDKKYNLVEIAEENDRNLKIKEALDKLPPRERLVVILLNGLFGQKYHTLDEVRAKLDNISRERVRQLNARALRQLHPLLKKQNLEVYS